MVINDEDKKCNKINKIGYSNKNEKSSCRNGKNKKMFLTDNSCDFGTSFKKLNFEANFEPKCNLSF